MQLEEVAQIDICATDMVGRFMVRDIVTPESLHFLEDGQKKAHRIKRSLVLNVINSLEGNRDNKMEDSVRQS